MGVIDAVKEFFGMSNLPGWVKEVDGRFYVDSDKAYPLYLDKLAVAEIDQYWIEVARRCFTEDLQKIVGGPLYIIIQPKSGAWALRNFPEGLGEVAGAAGFRKHYNQMNKG